VLLVLAVLAAIFLLPTTWGIAAVIGATAIELAEIGLFVWYSKRRRATTGAEGLVGRVGVVVAACDPDGYVQVEGELWKARCPEGAGVDEQVVVERVETGLTLVVAAVHSGRG
jgi:membrane protein implicated in regulation of membrane protease activity